MLVRSKWSNCLLTKSFVEQYGNHRLTLQMIMMILNEDDAENEVGDYQSVTNKGSHLVRLSQCQIAIWCDCQIVRLSFLNNKGNHMVSLNQCTHRPFAHTGETTIDFQYFNHHLRFQISSKFFSGDAWDASEAGPK